MKAKKEVAVKGESRFHAEPRELTAEEQSHIADLQDAYGEVESVLKRLHGAGASVSAAMAALEESYMWAVRDFAGLNHPAPPPASARAGSEHPGDHEIHPC
jgi:hypothetical protein